MKSRNCTFTLTLHALITHGLFYIFDQLQRPAARGKQVSKQPVNIFHSALLRQCADAQRRPSDKPNERDLKGFVMFVQTHLSRKGLPSARRRFEAALTGCECAFLCRKMIKMLQGLFNSIEVTHQLISFSKPTEASTLMALGEQGRFCELDLSKSCGCGRQE